MEKMGDRIRTALRARSESVSAFAQRTGLNKRTINHIIAGVNPSVEMAEKIAAGLDVSLEWLITGRGQMQSGLSKSAQSTIRHFDIAASAGNGRVVLKEPDASPLAVSEKWLWDKFNRRPDDVCTVQVEGDSMEPDIPNGSLALIDLTAPSRGEVDGVWLFREGDRIAVKRLQFMSKGKIQIISANETLYKARTLNLAKIGENHFSLIGTVLGMLAGSGK